MEEIGEKESEDGEEEDDWQEREEPENATGDLRSNEIEIHTLTIFTTSPSIVL
ncbi:hypothetical protein SLEP1_g51040 [Rubroshorea leprosula]|uniref:Uncharacterized protein n=1 Tax=Rubroshorea leprosula TaxID=152421 RepID=A0AAV5M2T9_9ROSI|nr:hypothetical protein SLEP1_g51040 [Rubroshorea leprosula]